MNIQMHYRWIRITIRIVVRRPLRWPKKNRKDSQENKIRAKFEWKILSLDDHCMEIADKKELDEQFVGNLARDSPFWHAFLHFFLFILRDSYLYFSQISKGSVFSLNRRIELAIALVQCLKSQIACETRISKVSFPIQNSTFLAIFQFWQKVAKIDCFKAQKHPKNPQLMLS